MGKFEDSKDRISSAARKAVEQPVKTSEEYEAAIRSVKGLNDEECRYLLELNPHRARSFAQFLKGVRTITGSDDPNVARLAKGMYCSLLAGILSSHGTRLRSVCMLIVQRSTKSPLNEFVADLEAFELQADERALIAACHPECEDLEQRLQVLKESEAEAVAEAAADLISIFSER